MPLGTFINDVPRFLTIFDLPTYLPCPTTLDPPPTLVWASLMSVPFGQCSFRKDLIPFLYYKGSKWRVGG